MPSAFPKNLLTRDQHGMALVMGLVLLLIVTLLAVAMMRGTTMQERMSANAQQSAITFQGAEAAIRAVMDELRAVKSPPPDATQSILVTALQVGPIALNSDGRPNMSNLSSDQISKLTRPATTGNNTTNSATLTYSGTAQLTGYRLGVDTSSYIGYQFIVDSTSVQANTGSASHHQQVVMRAGPSTN